jgi:hypothetical protein
LFAASLEGDIILRADGKPSRENSVATTTRSGFEKRLGKIAKTKPQDTPKRTTR